MTTLIVVVILYIFGGQGDLNDFHMAGFDEETLREVLIAAGLEGIRTKRDPGKRLDIDMYTEGHRARGVKKLPLNLLDAIRATQKSRILRAGLGDELIDSYTKLKLRQWDAYSAAITPWEREQTLDC